MDKGQMRILIAAHPFGTTGRKPLDLLQETGWELIVDPLERRLKIDEARDLLAGVDGVIAGTENYDSGTLSVADRLKVVSRVGIGLDNVDLEYCKNNHIVVTYTPDAPSDAVAELTVANILNLIRHVHESDWSVRAKAWNRLMGKLIREITIGVIGVGRIGGRVINLLQPFQPNIVATDIDPEVYGREMPNVVWRSLEELLRSSDLVTLHIPMNEMNRHLIDRERIGFMSTGSFLINSSRGPIVDEDAITDALLQRHLAGAALDVFETEPYEGPLTDLDNVLLTAHLGASARLCRYNAELGAVMDCIRALKGEKPENDAVADELG